MWDAREIDGIFYVGPNGLHRNFITQQIPAHMPKDVAETAAFFYWRTEKAGTKWHDEAARAFLAHKGYKVGAISYDGMVTDKGKAWAKAYLTSGRRLYGADETGRIKEPEAWRTQVILGSASFAPYRRVMTGTPVSNAPWDVWTQIKFIDDDFWKPHGLNSIEAMRAAFGRWEKTAQRVHIAVAYWDKGLTRLKTGDPKVPPEVRITYRVPRDEAGHHHGFALKEIPKLVTDESGKPQYKDLDRLRAIIAPIRSRVLKDDVFDLPPKLWTPLEFDLSPAQQRAYDSMRKLGFAISESGQTCSANLALTVLLRLQQIACGYIVADLEPGEEDPRVEPISPNPRLDLLMEITADLPHQALIWARFRPDIDAIIMALAQQGRTCARYDGAIDDEEAGENEERFHKGDVQFLVLNQAKGGEGLTLIEAKTAIYYSNTFKLIERLQSSDRPHRWGQTHPVNEIDLIARGTVDEKLIASLRAKYDVASTVQGDNLKAWLDPNAALPAMAKNLFEPA